MPIIIIIIGLAIAIGVGGYFLRPQSVTSPEPEVVTLPEPEAEPEVRDADTAPVETGDDALGDNNVPAEEGDNPTGATEPISPEGS